MTELIRSDIPGPSSAKSYRPSALRSSQSSVMKPSREMLQARVEFLVKKKISVKCKVPVAPKSSHAARGMVPKLGASSSPSTVRERGSSDNYGREVTRLILWLRC